MLLKLWFKKVLHMLSAIAMMMINVRADTMIYYRPNNKPLKDQKVSMLKRTFHLIVSMIWHQIIPASSISICHRGNVLCVLMALLNLWPADQDFVCTYRKTVVWWHSCLLVFHVHDLPAQLWMEHHRLKVNPTAMKHWHLPAIRYVSFYFLWFHVSHGVSKLFP